MYQIWCLYQKVHNWSAKRPHFSLKQRTFVKCMQYDYHIIFFEFPLSDITQDLTIFLGLTHFLYYKTNEYINYFEEKFLPYAPLQPIRLIKKHLRYILCSLKINSGVKGLKFFDYFIVPDCSRFFWKVKTKIEVVFK